VVEPVRVRALHDPQRVQQEQFLGSPTVRISGHDVEPGADRRRDYGLTCRLYAGSDGMRGAPPDEWELTMLHQQANNEINSGPPGTANTTSESGSHATD
jgi:hypothetical protein